MISGLNQDIDILGRVFHFQTELTGPGGFSIRTEVFAGGKVVATREGQIDGSERDGGEDVIRARMKEHHSRTITTFVTRAKRYQERAAQRAGAPAGETAAAPVETVPVPAETVPAATVPARSATALRPPSVIDAIDALRVRRLFGEFRNSIGAESPSPDEIGARLESSTVAFERLLNSPVFSETRVDEQAQCHLVKEQVELWLEGERDPWQARQIWREIDTLISYLAEINRRAELVEFDQQLLIWALDEVQRHGMSDDMFERLGALYGRHPHLDRVLEAPEGVSDGAWIARLRGVLMVL